MLAKIPLGRFAEVEDVTSCILFLLSERSKRFTMLTLLLFPLCLGHT